MEKEAEEMVEVISIFLLVSIKQYDFQFVSTHFQVYCFDKAVPTSSCIAGGARTGLQNSFTPA